MSKKHTNFADTIAEFTRLRISHRYSYNDIQERTKIPAFVLKRLETYGHFPHWDTLIVLARLYGKKIEIKLTDEA